jgi:hypothetical protein
MSLRVQARDSKGNLVVQADFGEDFWEEAFRTANTWTGDSALTVEFFRTPDDTWTCHDCGVRVFDLLADECALCGAARLL